MGTVPRFITKTEYAVDSIRQAIAFGELKPGDWIRSEEWAKRMGLSPTPVREALRQLEADGVVTIYAHRGAQITAFSKDEVEDYGRILFNLQSLAIEMAFERMSPEEHHTLFQRMTELDATCDQALDEGDARAAIEANNAFHMALYAASRSPRLANLIQSFLDMFPHDRLNYTIQWRQEAARAGHRKILDALARRSLEDLLLAVEEHQKPSHDRWLELAVPQAEASAAPSGAAYVSAPTPGPK